jgi:hypothetical protein
VAAPYTAWNVLARSNTGIVGSNPARGMDILTFILSVDSAALQQGWSLSKGDCNFRINPPMARTGPHLDIFPAVSMNICSQYLNCIASDDRIADKLEWTGKGATVPKQMYYAGLAWWNWGKPLGSRCSGRESNQACSTYNWVPHSYYGVTTGGFWTDDQIYWARDYTLQFTITHTVSTAKSSIAVAR